MSQTIAIVLPLPVALALAVLLLVLLVMSAVALSMRAPAQIHLPPGEPGARPGRDERDGYRPAQS